MRNSHGADPEFERVIQLQILEHEQNSRRSPHDWNKPLNASLDKRSGMIDFHRDRLGFEYHGLTSKFRAALIVRFAHRLRAAPLTLTLEFRDWSPQDIQYRMHPDRLGFENNFGPARLVGPRTKAITAAVLTARFATRLRALPCEADLKVAVPQP